MELTERQRREKEFYEDYSRTALTTEVSFDPISGGERRPWNSYWRVYELAMERFRKGGRLLDFCCGTGATSLVFAKIGYDVEGFDITPANIEVARKLASRYGLSKKASFSVRAAEMTGFPDASFDMIAGIDVLHHVDIASAIAECARLLKKGGMAVFREPVDTPLFDTLRSSWPLVKVFPKGRSLERHVTEDERKLNMGDLAVIRRAFPAMEVERFTFLSRLDPFVRRSGATGASLLEKADYRIFKLFPPARSLGGGMVIKLVKK